MPSAGLLNGPSRRSDGDLRAERRQIGKPVVDDARGLRIVEHAEAAADAHLGILARRIGESHPGSEIGHGAGGAAGRHARIAREQQSRRRVGELLRPDAGLEFRNAELLHPALDFVPREVGLIAHSVSQGKPRGGVPAVGDIERREQIPVILELARALVEGAQFADHEGRQRIAHLVGGEGE